MASKNLSPLKKRALWSPHLTDQLIELVAQKVELHILSKKLGKTEKAIRRKCERLKISCSPLYKKTQ